MQNFLLGHTHQTKVGRVCQILLLPYQEILWLNHVFWGMVQQWFTTAKPWLTIWLNHTEKNMVQAWYLGVVQRSTIWLTMVSHDHTVLQYLTIMVEHTQKYHGTFLVRLGCGVDD